MSIPAKTLYALQQAILKDSDLGPIAIAQARAQSPGLAKRAVLNKKQSTWFFNLLKTDFAAGLPEDDLLYYRHWSSGAPLELRNKPLLTQVLGLSSEASLDALPVKPASLPKWKSATARSAEAGANAGVPQPKRKAAASKPKKVRASKKKVAMKSLVPRPKRVFSPIAFWLVFFLVCGREVQHLFQTHCDICF